MPSSRRRRGRTTSASYALTVSLKPDAPTGFMRDEIRLISNDAGGPEHPAHGDGLDSRRLDGRAVGRCRWARSIRRPELRAGSSSASSRPFAIRSIEGAGDGFSTSPPDATRQSTHVVTVAYKPEEGTTRGDIRHVFRVHTDLPGEPPLDLTATLHVDP